MQYLNSKELKMAVKRGLTTEEVCSRYGINSADLHDAIYRAVGKNEDKTNGFISALSRNSKKTRGKNVDSETTPEANDVAENDAADDGDVVGNAAAIDDCWHEVSEESTADKLQKLQETREAGSVRLCELEKTFYQLKQERNGILHQMRDIGAEMKELEKIYLKKEVDFCNLKATFDAAGQQLNEISIEHRALREQCDELDMEIEILKTVQIDIIDGTLYLGNNSVDEAELEGYGEVYTELLNRDDEELDLKKSQLITLAKVYRYATLHEKVDFEFDSEEIESAYRFLRGQFSF